MTLGPWLHVLHIGGAMIWIGGGVMLSIIGARARRSGDIAIMREFAGTLSFVGLRVFTPSVIVVLLTGIWLVFAEQSGDFTRLWVLLALGAFAVAFLIGAVYLSRSAILLQRIVSGPAPDVRAAREALGRWMLGYGVVLAVLAFALWDMVFKPGA